MEQYTQNQLAAIREQMELEALLAEQASLGQRAPGQDIGLPEHFQVMDSPIGLNSVDGPTGAIAETAEDYRSPLGKYRDFVLDGTESDLGQRDIGSDLAFAPIRFAKYGADKLHEGAKEGSYSKALGGGAALALSALPAASKARDFINSTGGIVATGTGMGLAPALAEGVFDQAFASDDSGLGKQIDAMNAKRDDLLLQKKSLYSRRLPERNSGLSRDDVASIQRQLGLTPDGSWGPNTAKAVREFNRNLDLKMKSIDTELVDYSPEKIANFRRDQEEQDRLAQAKADEEFWSQSTRDAFPWLAPATSTAGFVGAGLLGRMVGKQNANRLNKEVGDISKRWKGAVDKANDPTNLIAAQQGAKEAQHFSKAMDDAVKRNPADPGLKTHLTAAAAADFGMAAPEIVDVARGVEDKDFSWDDFLKRMAYATVGGVAASKGTSLMVRKDVQPVKRYDAETNALKDNFGDKNALSHYGDRRQLNKLRDVEDFYSSRDALLQNDARTRQLADLKQRSELQRLNSPEGRNSRSQEQGQSGQEQQIQRQSPSRRQTSRKPSKAEEIRIREQIAKDKIKNNNRKPKRQDYERLEDFLSAKAKAQNTKKGKFSSGYKGDKPKGKK